MTMKEKIARALMNTCRGESVTDQNFRMRTPLSDTFMLQADAVLEAMREPDDLMGLGLPEGYRPGSHSATQIWRAMIDAARRQT